MERDHHAAFQVQEVRQHPVGQFRGQDLQEGHSPVGPADLEHPAILEGEAVRGDEVLAGLLVVPFNLIITSLAKSADGYPLCAIRK